MGLALALTAALSVGGAAASGAAEPSQKRIVGGGVADPAEWPFAAALVIRGAQFCSASVVAPDAILTAAHCVYEADPTKIRVITGRPDLKDKSVGQKLRVESVHVPGSYFRRGRRDVAIVRLQTPTSAPAVELTTAEQDEAATTPGMPVATAGWGATRANGSRSSKVLRDVEAKVVGERRCERRHPRFRGDQEICTVGEKRRKGRESACYGDSGGPLVAETPAGTRIVGTTSYGALRCGRGAPTVFSRVAASLGFIERWIDDSP